MKIKYKYIVAIIYTVALFLDRADLTIVNISLPTLARHFNVSIVATDWVNLSFLLALAIAIPISVWLGGKFGLKRVFITSMLLFGLGSTLCAFAPNLLILIILRFIHGIGGGMLIPVGMTLLYRTFDKSEYASITSFTFIPSLSAPAIAPLLGGVLLSIWNWHAVFLVTGPIALSLALFAAWRLTEDDYQNSASLDWPGFILASVILIDLFYLLSTVARDHHSLLFISSVVIFIPVIILFIYHEQRRTYPLINLNFFKNKTFIQANLAQLCFQISHFGAIFLVSMYLQIGAGISVILTGLIMGSQAISAMFTSRVSVHLFNRYNAELPIILGFLGIGIVSPCVLLINHPNLWGYGVVLFLIRGLFSGLCGTPIQALSVIGFSKNEVGSINTVFSACRQVSISFGVALSSITITASLAALGFNTTNNLSPHQAFKVFSPGFFSITAITVIGVLVTYYLRPTHKKL